jgi:hypothetical protein
MSTGGHLASWDGVWPGKDVCAMTKVEVEKGEKEHGVCPDDSVGDRVRRRAGRSVRELFGADPVESNGLTERNLRAIGDLH